MRRVASRHWTGARPISAEVVAAVAEGSGRETSDVQPLYTVLDPDALDALFDYGQTPAWEGQFSFRLDGYRVTVDHTGEIVVEEPAEGASGAGGASAAPSGLRRDERPPSDPA
jgi:hypothetical protein